MGSAVGVDGAVEVEYVAVLAVERAREVEAAVFESVGAAVLPLNAVAPSAAEDAVLGADADDDDEDKAVAGAEADVGADTLTVAGLAASAGADDWPYHQG